MSIDNTFKECINSIKLGQQDALDKKSLFTTKLDSFFQTAETEPVQILPLADVAVR